MQWLIDILFGMVAGYLQGMILMWSGTIATIPDGWVLCDGNNSTPDLRDKFIVCAQADLEGKAQTAITEPPTQEGGGTEHQHSFDADLHSHESLGGVSIDVGTEQQVWDRTIPNDFTAVAATTGLTDTQGPITVPYFALAFIMKT